MIFSQVLGIKSDIIAARAQVLGNRCIGFDTGILDAEIADFPILDKLSQLTGRVKTLELPQAFECQNMWSVEFLILAC